MVLTGVIIMLVVSFIIATIKMKKQKNAIDEERKKNEIQAPKSKKRFVQGTIISKQEIITPNEGEIKNE